MQSGSKIKRSASAARAFIPIIYTDEIERIAVDVPDDRDRIEEVRKFVERISVYPLQKMHMDVLVARLVYDETFEQIGKAQRRSAKWAFTAYKNAIEIMKDYDRSTQ
jgi:hypothetical protein